MNTNFIKFENKKLETAKGKGTISTLKFDLEISVEPVTSDNELAPTHRIWGTSPDGHPVECGGIWKNKNKENGNDYFSLNIRDFEFKANLGKAAFQDDDTLQAIIPWAPRPKA